ncbi:MAG: FtsX-like permease family protein, partial [Bacteroidota bacterium]
QQSKVTQNKNRGYERDNVISFQWKENLFNIWNGLGEDGKHNANFKAFRQELQNVVGVTEVTNMHGSILHDIYGQNGITWKVDSTEYVDNFLSPVVGYDFMSTLGIEIKQGRGFSKSFNDDYSKLIINEAAAKRIGFDDPIGQIINVNGQDEIIGVINDFHYGSLFNSIEPLIFRFEPNGSNFMVKISGNSMHNTIKSIQELYEKFHPSNPFEFNFMDDDYQAIYESETRVSTLAKYASGLAILISCLGLLGLVLFTSERRQKEVGIRKILGASLFNIIGLLSKDFIKLILIAFTLAAPIAWYLMQQWLNNFADHIHIQWWLFVLTAAIIMGIASLVIGLQSMKIALINPVESLRNE